MPCPDKAWLPRSKLSSDTRYLQGGPAEPLKLFVTIWVVIAKPDIQSGLFTAFSMAFDRGHLNW